MKESENYDDMSLFNSNNEKTNWNEINAYDKIVEYIADIEVMNGPLYKCSAPAPGEERCIIQFVNCHFAPIYDNSKDVFETFSLNKNILKEPELDLGDCKYDNYKNGLFSCVLKIGNDRGFAEFTLSLCLSRASRLYDEYKLKKNIAIQKPLEIEYEKFKKIVLQHFGFKDIKILIVQNVGEHDFVEDTIKAMHDKYSWFNK